MGLAAIQLARAAGAEVFATASARKQGYLRSLGVEHVFDSRSTAFGREILDATGGAGVDVVLNSLTGEGFIDASLACLAEDGRFVELARRDILSEDGMAALRPDVAYSILDLYTLKQHDPARPGAALRQVLAPIATGELAPLMHTRWPLAETSAAMGFMRAARHIGKIALTTPPLQDDGATVLRLPPPSDADSLSVFTATCALKDDLKRAGLHVAQERGRSRLYGWYLTDEPTYSEHGLRVGPNSDGLSFGACRHPHAPAECRSNPGLVQLAPQGIAGAPVRVRASMA